MKPIDIKREANKKTKLKNLSNQLGRVKKSLAAYRVKRLRMTLSMADTTNGINLASTLRWIDSQISELEKEQRILLDDIQILNNEYNG